MCETCAALWTEYRAALRQARAAKIQELRELAVARVEAALESIQVHEIGAHPVVSAAGAGNWGSGQTGDK